MYEELIKALRCCAEPERCSCDGCPKYTDDTQVWVCALAINGEAAEALENESDAIQIKDHEIKRLQAENKTLRNELCLKCGLYREAHNGACNACRWRQN